MLLAPTPSIPASGKRLSRQLSDLYGQFNFQQQVVTPTALTPTLLLPADPLRVYQRLFVTGFGLYTSTGVSIAPFPLTALNQGVDIGGHPIQAGMMFKDFSIEVCQPVYAYATAVGTAHWILSWITAVP